MEKLDKQWIFHGHVQQNCELFEKTPNTLGLKNMAGVFILVGVGIAGGVCLIIIEVIYKKHQVKKQKRLDIARHAADKWRGTIEVSPEAGLEIDGKSFSFLSFIETQNHTRLAGDAATVQRGSDGQPCARHHQPGRGQASLSASGPAAGTGARLARRCGRCATHTPPLRSDQVRPAGPGQDTTPTESIATALLAGLHQRRIASGRIS